jgi:hypothetical protein
VVGCAEAEGVLAGRKETALQIEQLMDGHGRIEHDLGRVR